MPQPRIARVEMSPCRHGDGRKLDRARPSVRTTSHVARRRDDGLGGSRLRALLFCRPRDHRQPPKTANYPARSDSRDLKRAPTPRVARRQCQHLRSSREAARDRAAGERCWHGRARRDNRSPERATSETRTRARGRGALLRSGRGGRGGATPFPGATSWGSHAATTRGR